MKTNTASKLSSILCLFVSSLIYFSAYAEQTEKLVTLDDQTSVAVTIYNENLALIKDLRRVSLVAGLNSLAFRGVSAKIKPETALLRSLSQSKGFNVLEQNFDYDLLTPQKLLEKYVGKQIKVAKVNPATGEESIEDAIVLSTNQGVVLKINNSIEVNPGGRFIFDGVPDNLRDQPTLVIQLINPISDNQNIELSYLSGGLSWKADYVAELSNDDTELDLMGWVTLNNKSGTSYNDAKLQLVAGDVNRVREEMRHAVAKMERSEVVMDAAAPMSEEGLFEYHLYTLERPTTIANNQTKQVALLTASNIPVKKEFLLQGNQYYYQNSYGNIGQKLKVGVYVEFDNEEDAGLGIPMPKGIVRVYKKDQSGNAQFVGEDHIDHTPKKEQIRLKLGNAFDITADKKQVDFVKRTALGKYNYAYESAYEVELKNAKSEPVTVVVREPIPGDWKMISQSHTHKKAAASTAEWQIEIPSESRVTLEYRVLVRY